MTVTDKVLKDDVMRELEWDPKIDASHIGVIANDGAVTLTGHVRSYTEKMLAVKAAERVNGVKAVADELEVKLPSSNVRDDAEIAEMAARTLRWHTLLPDTIEAEVRNGVVTLKGEVEWSYQRQTAERAMRDITGVRSVINLIAVKPRVKADDVKRRIADTIKRNAALDASAIQVQTTNGTVHLEGTVHSLWEKRMAEQAAASAPGVKEVDNDLTVVI
jgi:osmotically-inducible protein OsmY